MVSKAGQAPCISLGNGNLDSVKPTAIAPPARKLNREMSQPLSEFTIRPNATRTLRDEFRDICNYFSLAQALAKRDVQVRYKQSIIGIAWAVAQPTLSVIVYTIAFSKIAGVDTGLVPYPLFVLSGLITWNYFARIVLDGANSLVANQSIITKVYFPRLLLPMVPALSGSIDAAIGLLLTCALLISLGHVPHLAFIMAPIGLVGAAILGYAFALILAPVNAMYRDVAVALPFFVQLGLFLSPVFYLSDNAPSALRSLLNLNPMSTLIGTVRAGVSAQDFPSIGDYLILLLWMGLLLYVGFRVFRRLENNIVDLI